ncbi:MAG TPA: hypothetical protein VIG33_17105 [Pseudobdellovibrionaceae bacterium]|jgi:hypothetical protein
MRAALLFLICHLISSVSFAEAHLDFSAIYSMDKLNASSEAANTQYFYNVDVLFNIDRRMQWNVGWSVLGISQTSTLDGATATYSSFDIGPALRWNIDKAGIFSMTLAYGYLAKGQYNSGNTLETWTGSSYFGQFAVQAPIADKLYVGFSLNYYAAGYSKKVVDSVESSSTAQKNWIFPMISFTWRP